tara:strand:- start:526 stop:810 length:285 start_codon:yes stop_codon:yes gene_type:complete
MATKRKVGPLGGIETTPLNTRVPVEVARDVRGIVVALRRKGRPGEHPLEMNVTRWIKEQILKGIEAEIAAGLCWKPAGPGKFKTGRPRKHKETT